MQVFGLPGHVIRNGRRASRLIDAKPPHIAAAIRRDALARWRWAMAQGLTAQEAARIVGVPRSTLYRWEKTPEPKSRRPHRRREPNWSAALVRAVEALRADNPMWGKRKLTVLLLRDGFAVSVSTVGRILANLVQRGVVTPVATLRSKPGGRRFRIIGKRHARRLPKGLKPSRPGELVQVDTLFLNIAPEKPIKHFTAYDPVAKWTVAAVAGRATANRAAAFLDKLLAEMPFKVSGIQVDGGSEFMADFEEACRAKRLDLYVLPPKRPQLNGAVERCNGAWRYEFYAIYELPHRLDRLQPFVDAFAHRFNHHRPHDALDGKTPAEYLQTLSRRDPAPSHMS
jgi:DNA-binding XRE family transcriptional regulator